MFGMESVYIGYSLQEFAAVREALAGSGIDYKYKVKNRAGEWLFPGQGTIRSRTGSAGMNADKEREYEVFVKKGKAEEARFVIHRHFSNPAL